MSPRPFVLLALLAGLAAGCEGQLLIERPGGDAGRPSTPRVEIDAGASGADAGPAIPLGDAGPGAPGCALPAEGTCEGTVARWCSGGQAQSEDCASTGRTCEVGASGGRAGCVDPVAPPPGCGSTEELAVIDLANQARAANGAGALTCDALMAQAARKHSQDMCNQGYFSHQGLDGRSPFDRMRDEGVTFGTAGENIAQGQRDAAAVHNAWMNSSGHRRNILNGAFGRIGVGLEECAGRMYWTQVFAD